jgi:hypothetical protein
MPFNIRPDSIFDGFKSTIMKTRQPVSIPAQGIAGAQSGIYAANFYITTDGANAPVNPVITRIILMVDQKSAATLTRQELVEFYNYVESNTDNNYRNVKTNALWRQMYRVQEFQSNGLNVYTKFDSKSAQISRVTLEVSYCQRCGIILPLRNLTIDHQKPQKGGDVEAMIRVFRAAGLTVSTGSGEKNRNIQRSIASKVGGDQQVLIRGQRGTNQDRYTLNPKGTIYFTMLQYYNLTDQMLQMSMHHVANLRPMCGPCNSSLRNTNITWVFA